MSKLSSTTTLSFEIPSITTSDALSGMDKLVLSALKGTTSISTESAVRFILSAETSIKTLAFANNVMKAMDLTMVLVKSLRLEIQSTLAANYGMAITTVLNAQFDSIQIKMEFVSPSPITAEHGTSNPELVNLAIKGM